MRIFRSAARSRLPAARTRLPAVARQASKAAVPRSAPPCASRRPCVDATGTHRLVRQPGHAHTKDRFPSPATLASGPGPTTRRPIVVTFTSIPPRFPNLGRKIASLARQSVQPDGVEIYLPRRYRRFPDHPRGLPALGRLPDWVELVEVEEDLGPATKVLPAARRSRGREVDLLLCDDDRPEDPGWIARFAAARLARPHDIVCEMGWNLDELGIHPQEPVHPRARVCPRQGKSAGYRMQRLLSLGLYQPPVRRYASGGYADVFMGVHGAMVPPNAFPDLAWNIPELLWTVDDVWLSGMADLNGCKVWVNDARRPLRKDGRYDRRSALKDFVCDGAGRSTANRRCVEYLRSHHGVWR